MSTIKNGLNICFMISTIQMLMSREDIIDSFSKVAYRYIKEIYEKGGVIIISTFIFYYRTLHREYITGTQQDARESLAFILDDATNKELFEIKYKQRITRSNETLENEMSENMISVVIRESLQKSIDSFFTTEEASTYDENGETMETPKIEFFPINNPKYLFVSLKRFDPITFEKNSTEVDIDEVINYNGNSYKCISFIIHIGTVIAGHYIEFTNRGKWVMYDDESFNENVTDEEADRLQRIGYIYLFEKQ